MQLYNSADSTFPKVFNIRSCLSDRSIGNSVRALLLKPCQLRLQSNRCQWVMPGVPIATYGSHPRHVICGSVNRFTNDRLDEHRKIHFQSSSPVEICRVRKCRWCRADRTHKQISELGHRHKLGRRCHSNDYGFLVQKRYLRKAIIDW